MIIENQGNEFSKLGTLNNTNKMNMKTEEDQLEDKEFESAPAGSRCWSNDMREGQRNDPNGKNTRRS